MSVRTSAWAVYDVFECAGQEIGEPVEFVGVLNRAAPNDGLEAYERYVVLFADQQHDTVFEYDTLEVGKGDVCASARCHEAQHENHQRP